MHIRNILFIEFTKISLCSFKSKLKQGDRVLYNFEAAQFKAASAQTLSH